MSAITNELVTSFQFEGSIQPLENYNESFTDAISIMAKGIGVITAVTGAMYGFATAQLDVIDNLGQLSRETGTSIEFLQEMGYVASVNGGSIDSMQNSMRGLSEKIGEASLQGSEDFNRLGISVRDANGQVKSTQQVLGEVQNSFKGLTSAQQISFAQKLGIDKGMLQTLNLTNKELDAAKAKIRAVGVVSEEDANKVIAFNDSLTTSQMALNGIGKQVALGMLPNMQNLVNIFNDFLFANVDLIKNGLLNTVSGFENIISAVINTGRAIGDGIDYFIGMENALMVAGAAVLYFNKALLLNPIGLIVGAIVGLVAIVDDLYIAFNGGQSVIKDFFASFDIDIVNALKNVFDGLKFTLNSFFVLLINVSSALTDLILLGAKAGNFLGLDIDTSGIEEFKKLQETTKVRLTGENQKIANDISGRSVMTQPVSITQNIQGSDPQRVAELSNNGVEEAITAANAQVGKGGR